MLTAEEKQKLLEKVDAAVDALIRSGDLGFIGPAKEAVEELKRFIDEELS